MVTSPLAETKFNSCSGRSQQNEPWNLLCLSRLVESVIFMYVNPWTFSKISFCQSLAETSVEQKYRPEDYETFFQASFTNNLHYRWHYMDQQWERSLFCQFQLLGSYWKVHWLKLAPGLKKVQWGKPTPPNIFFRPILPNFEKKLKSETMILGGGPCSQSVRHVDFQPTELHAEDQVLEKEAATSVAAPGSSRQEKCKRGKCLSRNWETFCKKGTL